LIFGKTNTHKSRTCISFPEPYVIDTERGCENEQYVESIIKSGGVYYHTTDFDEITSEVIGLMTEKHRFKTLVIDPLTVPYAGECDNEARRLATLKDPSGSEFGRNKQIPDRKIKHLCTLLFRLDMNVIITSHAKAEWKNASPTGQDTFDCYGRLEYIFDLVLESQKRGKERVAVVRKSRILGFEESETFPLSYDEIANRYGREHLERDAGIEILASAEQVAEIKRLVDLLKVPEETCDKWMEKAMANNWSQMPADAMQKCIEHLHNQLTGQAA
jgi:hypothetical protein